MSYECTQWKNNIISGIDIILFLESWYRADAYVVRVIIRYITYFQHSMIWSIKYDLSLILSITINKIDSAWYY